MSSLFKPELAAADIVQVASRARGGLQVEAITDVTAACSDNLISPTAGATPRSVLCTRRAGDLNTMCEGSGPEDACRLMIRTDNYQRPSSPQPK